MKRRILLIEDQNAFLVRELVSLFGDFEFEIAVTGSAGIEKLAGSLPDLVLLDLRLPGVGGLAVLKTIKRIEPCLPVVIVSAYGDKSTRQACRDAGADDFFQKPFEPRRLAQRMEILLAMYHSGPRVKISTPGREVYQAKVRRLQKLRKQQAQMGLNTPPEVLIEIEDLEDELGPKNDG